MKVRMLRDEQLAGVLLPANSVPDLRKAVADSLCAAGAADSNTAAVTYALTLGVSAPDLPAELAPAAAQSV